MAKTEPSRLALLVAVLLVLVVVVVVQVRKGSMLGGGRRSAEDVAYQQHEVPVLELAALTPAAPGDRGGAANPFVYRAPPTPTPNLTPRPTLPPRPTIRPRVRPTPRMIQGPGGKMLPPPPKFDKKFIGYFGPNGRTVAVFREGEKIEVAAAGGVLDEKFIVRTIGFRSVEIGYVGYPEEVTKRVPIEK